jgi:hypothetical protein
MNFHSRQIPVQYLKLGHNFFSLHPLQVTKVILTLYITQSELTTVLFNQPQTYLHKLSASMMLTCHSWHVETYEND